MAKKRKSSKVRDYRHEEKRKNNPPIGMVSYEAKIAEPKMNRYTTDVCQVFYASRPSRSC